MPTVKTRELRDGSKTYYVRLRNPAKGTNTSEVFNSKRAAEQFVKMVDALGPLEAIARREREQNGGGSSLTVEDIFTGYIAWKALEVRSDRTISDYKRDYRNWIQQPFGRRLADTVTGDDVQRWVESMMAQLSPKSVIDRHSLLHGVYEWATMGDRPKVAVNPCKRTRLPKRRKTQPKGMHPNEWKALHIALRQIDPDAADLALFLAWTGWRFSEAAALSAYDVEDYGREVYVTMSRVLRRNAAGEHRIVDDGKTEDSLRRIQLSGDAVTMVRRRLDHVAAGGLVFTTKNGAQIHYSNFLNRAWKPAVKAAGLGRNPTPHSLRHSHVVWLAQTHQVSLAEIQKRIGHQHIATTIGTYGRMIGDVTPAALTALEQLIGSDVPLEISSGT